MNSKNIIAITNTERICFKCLKAHKESEIYKIHIPSAGYGSYFDNLSTELQLCDPCYAETNSEWWKFERVPYSDDGGEKFKYDDEIYAYLKNLLLPGQEIVFNRFAYGTEAVLHIMESQDWIDFELGKLSRDMCRTWVFYSDEVIKAYKERFPTSY